MPKYYITINDFQICISDKNIYDAVYAANEVFMKKVDEGLHDIADMPYWVKVNQAGFTVPNSQQTLIPYALILSGEWDGTTKEICHGENVSPETVNELIFLDGTSE